ncbi:hypothetical protein AMTR_s05431p00006580 [Amborella trichopoda]|uniref:Uncharacterized protein n=1 Tax=Amborella trichopoda TaxID=13333 RepID=U5CW21_AMBTC|nr:hypothetical protein AMTR_s05431p00006580 [Amborella trichopoda]
MEAEVSSGGRCEDGLLGITRKFHSRRNGEDGGDEEDVGDIDLPPFENDLLPFETIQSFSFIFCGGRVGCVG